ncbi:MAG: diguanylate cyclase [Planctomycetaceae bacterium]|nr:diguanylate cyclase [Planctomycetales bacterium]MCB9937641.1 diguanylate cyclase [Planctomycetaceae bacterium]
MKRITISFRIAMCLALLSLCGVLIARVFGLFPDTHKIRLQGRIALCESLAINCSMLASRADFHGIERNLVAFVTRNEDVRSAALRRADGELVIQVGNHAVHWTGTGDGQSTDGQIYVPIASSNRNWGNVEVAFQQVSSVGSTTSWLSQFMEFAIFLTGFNAVLFAFWLRRVLMHLDPSRVMPQRVRSALDTLAEGLLVLDSQGRIVMANKSFATTIGQEPHQLQGRVASDLAWMGDQDPDKLPWNDSLRDNAQRVGVPLQLKTGEYDERSFHVNVAPIFGEDGKSRGALASFDDVTELEAKRYELLKMLKTLKASREEIQEQNEQLKLLATIDPLTECMNRRSFFPLFDQHWEDSQTNDKPLCGFMVDIDHFKSINDNHGHGKGDEVLKGVAACLREQVGTEGLVCRFGGEEFCVLLPGYDVERAVALAETIRIAMSEIDFEILTITASLGVSSIHLGASSPQEMLEQADKCLYVAKRSGRNQVVAYTLEMESVEVDESKVRRTKPDADESSHTHIPFPAVASLMSALAYRHAETAEHSARVADLCVAVGRSLMSVSEAYILEIAALLHDIGKIGVPDAILLKPGELTTEEWRVMKMNERIGVEIVGSAFYYEPLVDMIRLHKAPYDSRNEVTRLPMGDALPLGARILAIADAYDAMVTQRSYRKARLRDEAFCELRRCAGTQFDPDLVERFIEVVCDKPQLSQTSSDKMSRQTAVQMATQIEELARALDEQDLATIEALAGRLQATAACAGATEMESLAAKLNQSVTESDDASEIFELTIELMDLCRSAQRAAVATN